MNNKILIALSDSMSSRATVDFLSGLALCPEQVQISLLHVFRKPSAGEDLMGKKFMQEQPARRLALLESTRDRLVEDGFHPGNISVQLVTDPYPTVADGIIDQFRKGNYNMVVIGRKKMSKAEEFVLGDPSVKLVRVLEGTAVLVVKSNV